MRGRHPGYTRENLDAGVLVRPGSTDEVAAVMRHLYARGIPVVPQGGLTGLVQGAVSRPGEVILSLERMKRIERVDPVDRVMVAEAGVTLEAAQEAAAAHGLMVPVDIGARGACTLGGNVATNAGGQRVMRYGMTRDMVLGLEVVLPDGEVLPMMHALVKNNTGYDLKHLFIGAEGTLGVVTRVVLRLHEAPVRIGDGAGRLRELCRHSAAAAARLARARRQAHVVRGARSGLLRNLGAALLDRAAASRDVRELRDRRGVGGGGGRPGRRSAGDAGERRWSRG